MVAIKTNNSVGTRTLDLNHEIKRKLEEGPRSAIKTDNRSLELDKARVSFSQEALTRLSAERSRDARQADAVRLANDAKSASEYSRALRQEIAKAGEKRTENQNLVKNSDKAAQIRSEATAKHFDEDKRRSEETADRARATKAAMEQAHTQNTKAINMYKNGA